MSDELDEAAVLEEAIEAHHRGDQERAIALCSRLIEADEWAQPFYFRGAARLALGDAAAALDDLTRSIGLDPEVPYFAYHDRGRALAALNRHEEALADYQRAIAVRPDVASTRNRMGTTLFALGRLDDALAAYAEAARLAPGRADYHFDLGAAHLAMGGFNEAIAGFTRAIERAPEAHYYFSRGTAHLRAGAQAAALADLDRAIELDPGHARAWYARGYARYVGRQREQGEADFARAVELDSSLEDWHYEKRWLGEQCDRVGRYLRSRGLPAGRVPKRPSWCLAPYLALWRIGGRKKAWVLVGDGPTDHLAGDEAEGARSALAAFGRRWRRAAENVLAGRADPEVEVGPPEEWPKLGEMLRTRAELLAEFSSAGGPP